MTDDSRVFAEGLRARGVSWGQVLSDLHGEGVTEVDMVRLVRDVEGVGVGRAREIVGESGLFESQDFVMVVDEDDPWYAEILGSESGQADQEDCTP